MKTQPPRPFVLSHPIPYARYLDFQRQARLQRKESLLALQHPPTITAGTNAQAQNLLLSPESLQNLGIDHHSIPRGGDFTAHEGGQWVFYPHIDIRERDWPLGDFLAFFLGSIQDSVKQVWGIELEEKKTAPGLYSVTTGKKIASIGVYFKSFFTSFGASVNVSNSLDTFRHINPCGISSGDMSTLVHMGADPQRESDFLKKVLEKWRNHPKLKA